MARAVGPNDFTIGELRRLQRGLVNPQYLPDPQDCADFNNAKWKVDVAIRQQHDAPGPGLVRRDHQGTSKNAAALVAPKTGTQRWKILQAVFAWGWYGAIREELQDALKMDGNTLRPRVKELIDGGFLEAHPEGKTRKTRQKRDSEVLVATEKGKSVILQEGT